AANINIMTITTKAAPPPSPPPPPQLLGPSQPWQSRHIQL
ncbi:unnamed protein product, partial [Rotaria magnacalcarata]